MNNNLEIKEEVYELVSKWEDKLKNIFKNIEEDEFYNSKRVLEAFHHYNVSESDFATSTGYGYNDVGRDKIEAIFAQVLGGEDALVRSQFISGTHALTVALFALLRPGDKMLSITGLPYDTLHEVIGIKENKSSLASYNILYDQIDLVDDDFAYVQIKDYLENNHVKLIEIQRSKGYSTRKSINIKKLEKVINLIKAVDKNIIVMVDNCYCEFVEKKTPLEVGADICVGSLIKNLGGGIASNGAYIAGKKELINLCAERLNVPGEAKEVGPSMHFNREFLMGLYHAPSAVASSLKVAILTSAILEELGYQVEPKYQEERVDIVQNIYFGNAQKLIDYCCGIQSSSAVDSNSLVEATDMPGYDDQIVMASGSFTQGSSIEISCDGPLRSPYIAYQQGSLTYAYGKLAIMVAISNLLK